MPAFLPQVSRGSTVAPFVYPYLRGPERHVRLREFCSRAIPVTMPKATVDKNRRLPRFDGKVRLPWQTSIIPAVSQAEFAKKRAHGFLGCGTFVSYARHDLASFRLAVNVSHNRYPRMFAGNFLRPA